MKGWGFIFLVLFPFIFLGNAIAQTTINAPTGLEYSNLQDTQVTVTWTASVGATGYNVYRNGTLIGTTTLTSYIDNLIVPNTSYSYTVAAYNTGGVSVQSTPISIKTSTDSFSSLRPSATGSTTAAGQACTSTDLNGYTCQTVAAGFTGGTLACKSDGSGYDVSGCTPGAAITAASCNQWDVQNAINQASNGETVLIPAGTCAWEWPVVIGGGDGVYLSSGAFSTSSPDTTTYPGMAVYPGTSVVLLYNSSSKKWVSTYPAKSIILKGAGAGNTIIEDETATNTTYNGSTIYPQNALYDTLITGSPVRISGITFDGTQSRSSQGPVGLTGPAGRVLFRIDHCSFVNLYYEGILVTGVYGVVDHNTLANGPGRDSTGVQIDGDMDAAWARALTLGTENAVYMEDNTFNWNVPDNGPYDAYVGARYVLRYNNINGTWMGHHGFDSSQRGTFSWEIYNNFLKNPTQNQIAQSESRSGTGVIFNNVYPLDAGLYNSFFSLRNYRSDDAAQPNYGYQFPWNPAYYITSNVSWNGTCNGTAFLVAEVVEGGSGYQVGDILTLVQNGGSGGTVTVQSVNGNGGVLIVVPTTPGTGYTPASSGVPVTGGHGHNATIGIGMDGNMPGMLGYPCEDQNGRTTNQALAPIYAWNNNFKGEIGGDLVAAQYTVNANKIAAATSISQAFINNGGENYVVGDKLNIIQSGASGGKGTVTSIGPGGVITGLSVTYDSAGTGYTTANGLATTGGSGNGQATVNITCPETYTVTLGNGGSGYNVNDVLEVVEPGAYGLSVTVTSTTTVGNSTGVINGIKITPETTGTGYTITNNLPTVYQSNGSGTGATVNITAIIPVTEATDRYASVIEEGRDFYNTQSPDYVPYPYPHPLVQMDAQSTTTAPVLYGDVLDTGHVTIYDAELTAQYAIGLPVANFDRTHAQVDGNNTVDIYDAYLIAEYAIGLITKFAAVQP